MSSEPTNSDRKGTSPPAVWATMANDVREYDQDNVKRGKGDVDTLLVFAGLFSAVLASFLVAVYPSLQPSPMDVMNYTLQRIANQTASYNFTDGRMIATNPSFPPPPFQASAENIRVNVLWFASLVISLITSSFGMLVKQWMDDFLAVDIPEPQARLRLRHHRAPQIEAWLVYEIVACLPLLLHLSLGLFFVGLCYFTSAIHASIGYTTLPLVIGWTFCLFFSTALPIFFPRCPYKISLFKPMISRLHRTLSHLVDPKRVQRSCHHYLSNLSSAIKAVACQARDKFRPQALQEYLDWQSWRPRSGAVLRTLRSHPAKAYTTIIQALRDIPDEDKVAKDSAADLKIFAEVDAMRANDEILCAIVAEELPLINPDWKNATMFAIEALAHRARTVAESERLIPEWPFRDPFPFDLVRSQARESILAIIYQGVGAGGWHHSGWDRESILDAPRSRVSLSLDSEQRAALCTLIMILSNLADFSGSEVNLPPNIISFLRLYLDEHRGPFVCLSILHLIGWHCKDQESYWNNATSLLMTLTKLAAPLELTWKGKISCFKSILCLKAVELQGQVDSAVHLTWDYPDGFGIWKDWKLPYDAPDTLRGAALEYLFVCLSAEFRRVEDTKELSREDFGNEEALEVFNCALGLYLERPFPTVLMLQAFVYLTSMKNKDCMDVIIESLVSADLLDAQSVARNLGGSYSTSWSYHILFSIHDQYIKSSNAALNRSFATLSSLVTEKLANPDTDLVQSLSLCHVAVFLLLAVYAQSVELGSGRDLFSSIATALAEKEKLRKCDTEAPDNAGTASQLAFDCLYIMDYEQQYNGSYDKWHAAFLQGGRRTSFPDSLVEVLGRFIPENRVKSLYRLLELQFNTHSRTLPIDTPPDQQSGVQLVEQDKVQAADESGSDGLMVSGHSSPSIGSGV